MNILQIRQSIWATPGPVRPISICTMCVGLLLFSCTSLEDGISSCLPICDYKINIYDGYTSSGNDPANWAKFGSAGSGDYVVGQDDPEYELRVKSRPLNSTDPWYAVYAIDYVDRDDYSYSSNGTMNAWLSLDNCITTVATANKFLSGEHSWFEGIGRRAAEQNSFYVESHATLCPGQCVLYELDFTNAHTLISNCKFIISVLGKPVRDRFQAGAPVVCVACP